MRYFIAIFFFIGLLSLGAHARNVRIAAAQLTSGPNDTYNAGHGIRILQGIDADIVLIQKLIYTTSTYANFATTTLGPGATFHRGSGTIPTGILSRYPIVEAGEWADPHTADRAFSWAKIDVPGDKFLWAVSVHFSVNQTNRANSAAALVTLIQQTVPASDYLVIGGNFNADSRTEAPFPELSAVVALPAAYPVDQAGNSNTNSLRSRPYENLLFNSELQNLATPTILGTNSFPSGLVLDTRVYTPIADVSPALVNDSAAHTHLAVIRDVSFGATPIKIIASSFTLTPSPSGQITFTSDPGVLYRVQASSTLADGSWQSIGGVSASPGTSTTFQIVPANPGLGQMMDQQLGTAPKRFYRIYR